MKVFVITMLDDPDSLARAVRAIGTVAQYTNLQDTTTFRATLPDTTKEDCIEVFGKEIPWSWPTSYYGECIDISTGLYKKMYEAKDQNRVIACALSHFRLWKKCIDLDEPILVLEHDARFIRDFDPSDLVISGQVRANASPPSFLLINSVPVTILPHWSDPPSWR